jgi:hypothetical protein
MKSAWSVKPITARLIGAGTVLLGQAAINAYKDCSGGDAPPELIALAQSLTAAGGVAASMLATDAADAARSPVSRKWNHDLLRASAVAISDVLKEYCRSNPSQWRNVDSQINLRSRSSW